MIVEYRWCMLMLRYVKNVEIAGCIRLQRFHIVNICQYRSIMVNPHRHMPWCAAFICFCMLLHSLRNWFPASVGIFEDSWRPWRIAHRPGAATFSILFSDPEVAGGRPRSGRPPTYRDWCHESCVEAVLLRFAESRWAYWNMMEYVGIEWNWWYCLIISDIEGYWRLNSVMHE